MVFETCSKNSIWLLVLLSFFLFSIGCRRVPPPQKSKERIIRDHLEQLEDLKEEIIEYGGNYQKAVKSTSPADKEGAEGIVKDIVEMAKELSQLAAGFRNKAAADTELVGAVSEYEEYEKFAGETLKKYKDGFSK